MITDGLLYFSTNQVITATADSTDILDLEAAGDIGAGEDVRVVITVTQVFATLTSLAIKLVGAAVGDSAFGSPQTLADTDAIPLANLVAGAQFEINVPRGWMKASGISFRYLKLTYTVAGSNATTGKVTAFLGNNNVQDNNPYPANFST